MGPPARKVRWDIRHTLVYLHVLPSSTRRPLFKCHFTRCLRWLSAARTDEPEPIAGGLAQTRITNSALRRFDQVWIEI